MFGRGSEVSSAGGRAAALHRTQLAGTWHPHLLVPIIAVTRQSTTDRRPTSIGHATESRQNFKYDERDRLTQAWTTGNAANSYNESYAYNNIGNLTSKAGTTYTYPAAGSARPHTPTTVGGASYIYDANGNLTGGSGRTYNWNAENLPTSISYTGSSENYSYDADGERVKLVRGSTTTVYLEGVWEEVVGGTTKVYYPFNGQTVALRDTSANTVTYLPGDHLGSVSVETTSSGTLLNSQEFDPWGKVRLGGVSQTSLNYTGQRLDGSKLLYYHARYYDPGLGRFVSADTVVPRSASGSMDGIALKPLTVDFHETGYVSRLNGENGLRFWFQMSDDERQKAGSPWGPANPQALNRNSYILNNSIRYVDPTGHTWYLSQQDAADYADRRETETNNLDRNGNITFGGAGSAYATVAGIFAGVATGGTIALMALGGYIAKEAAVRDETNLIKQIRAMNGSKGVAIAAYKESGKAIISVAIMNRATGQTVVVEISVTSAPILPDGVYIGTPHGNWRDPGYVFAHDFPK